MHKELIESCKRKDPKAQLQVYKIYYRQMFNISYTLVGNVDAATKIVRECFIMFFDKIPAFQGLADSGLWLKGLVEDKSVETWRRNNISSPIMTNKMLVSKTEIK